MFVIWRMPCCILERIAVLLWYHTCRLRLFSCGLLQWENPFDFRVRPLALFIVWCSYSQQYFNLYLQFFRFRSNLSLAFFVLHKLVEAANNDNYGSRFLSWKSWQHVLWVIGMQNKLNRTELHSVLIFLLAAYIYTQTHIRWDRQYYTQGIRRTCSNTGTLRRHPRTQETLGKKLENLFYLFRFYNVNLSDSVMQFKQISKFIFQIVTYLSSNVLERWQFSQ